MRHEGGTLFGAAEITERMDGPLREPLLKWPGGKRKLLTAILPLVPASYGTYYEPFVGGGAVFFALAPARAVLSDWSAELINCYCQVRDRPQEVIAHLRRMPNTDEAYYRIRASAPRESARRAARLLYLATLSFNGIYRVNRQGAFNVPYGKKAHLAPCDPAKIHAASVALLTAKLQCADFEDAVATAQQGDVVYLDPPYTVAHGDNGFLKYNSRIFSWDDQRRLASAAAGLAARGCRVIVSNADHPSILGLYDGFRCLRVERQSVIAASGRYRRRVTECVFYSKEWKRC